MKCKILLLSVIALTSVSAKAQILKGSTYIGGNFSVSSQRSEAEGQKTNSFYISPSIGKAIKENLIVGVSLNYLNSLYKYETPSRESRQTNYGAGVFVRKYLNLGSKFYLFGQGSLGGNFSENKYSTGQGTDMKSYSVNLNFYPGVAFEINRTFQLEAGLNDLFSVSYQHGNYYPDNSTAKNKFSTFYASSALNSNNWLSVGLRVLLNKQS
ncbi:MAG TPA: outer membrane beta-barrel protein [Flavitalea sp.]|nr:outer membrane beta-barrel protein [Flavitalea sp.]